MRIHLPLDPEHFNAEPKAGPSSSPIAQLGGDLVLIELQGEVSWEGDKADGVIGVLGLDRPDRPTLHLGEHHLLHGKFAALQRPYAVIRRVYGDPTPTTNEASGDGVDTSSESSGDEDGEIGEPSKRLKQRAGEEEEDGPLFPDIHTTPHHSRTNGKPNGHVPSSSSPFYPPSTPLDYSSDLDASSPARDWQVDQFGEPQNGDEEDKEDDEDARERREVEGMRVKRDESRAKVKARRKREEKERTRHYEVVGVVRKKVVFALRPEPIVTATVLPD